MRQQLCLSVLLICSCLGSIDVISGVPDRSIPQISSFASEDIETQSFTASFNVRSKISSNNETNLNWNGGTILTHQNNLQSLFGRSETTIASTRCNNLIFIAFNSAQSFCFLNDENNQFCPGVPDGFYNGVPFSVSLDGGETWKYIYAPPDVGTDIYTLGDPWLSMGGKSSKHSEELLYFSALAFNKRSLPTLEHIGLSVHVARIIYKDNDPRKQAINFEWIRASLIPKIAIDDFLDKEAIAADPFDANKAYVSYTLFSGDGEYVNIELYATDDAAVSWKGPIVLQKTAIIRPFKWSRMTYPVVGANGNVYVIWYEFIFNNDFMRNLKYMFVKSIDGGVTFPDDPIPINPDFISFNPLYQIPIAHNRDRLAAQPTMDVFTTVYDYQHNYLNRIIAAYQYSLNDTYNYHTGFIDDSSSFLNSANIGISYSDDAGTTWNYIDPFKEAIPYRFVKRIFPTVSVSSNGKSVNVAYFEINHVKRTDLAICDIKGRTPTIRTSFYHDMVDTYYIHSENGGITWSQPIKLNKKSVDWCTTWSRVRPNYGDYALGISDSKGGLHLAGITNDFTLAQPAFDPPLTAVDVIYYHAKPTKKKCNNGRRWSRTYNAWITEQHKEEHSVFSNLEEKNQNIEVDIPWIVTIIGIIVIVICISTPYLIWIEMNKK